MMRYLDQCYQWACNGISKESPPVTQMAEDYLAKEANPALAAKQMI